MAMVSLTLIDGTALEGENATTLTAFQRFILWTKESTKETFDIITLKKRFFLLDLSLIGRVLGLVTGLASLVIGLTARQTIFRMVFKTGIWVRPANLLILANQTTYTIHVTLAITITLCNIVFDNSVSYFLGETFCQLLFLCNS